MRPVPPASLALSQRSSLVSLKNGGCATMPVPPLRKRQLTAHPPESPSYSLRLHLRQVLLQTPLVDPPVAIQWTMTHRLCLRCSRAPAVASLIRVETIAVGLNELGSTVVYQANAAST